MGCTSSKTKAVGGSAHGIRKLRSNKSLDSVNISDDDMTKASNDIKNRMEREQALFQEIQAEKEALRKVAFRLIEQPCSCENLLDLLDDAELDTLMVAKDTVRLQKQANLKLIKSRPAKIKDWIIFNNRSNAINETKMECITEFMNFALLLSAGPSKNELKVPTRSKSQYTPSTHPDTDKKTATRQKSMYNKLPVGRNSLINGQSVGVEEVEKSLSSSNHSQYGFTDVSEKVHGGNSEKQPEFAPEELRQELLSCVVHTIAPQTSFYISDLNINDYDFAPGLVTISTVASVIELYKMGGRLSPRSVRKLLRLGYRSLKSRPNTTQIHLSGNDRLTVVGDIHGQLSDLLHIIDCSGLPSSSNRYLFNGDFVDRGPYGVEVMCVLLAMHAAMPEYVSLNRGNHEDYAICTAYGFQLECYEKYGEVIFGMFVEVFQQIPLFAIINNDVFVLHGGLFHNKQTTIQDLNAIQRTKFSLEDMPEGGEGTTEVPRAKRKEFLKQLVRDALWSDPVDQPGMHHSVRGAGIGFGPDVARNFLRHNNLKFIVRSHECVRSGYNEPYAGENQHLLCTIFSASDYGSSGNSAAFMVFRIHNEDEIVPKTPRRSNYNMTLTDVNSDDGLDGEHESELKLVEGSKLAYVVHYFYIDAEFRDGENINNLHKDDTHPTVGMNGRQFAKSVYQSMFELDESKQFFIENEINQTLCIGQPITLYNLILDKKFSLLDALIELDTKKEGMISMTHLVHTFIDQLQISLDLFAVLKVLLTEKCYRSHNGKNMVDYVAFMEAFEEKSSAPPPPPEEPAPVEEIDPNMDALARYMQTMERMKAANEKEKKANAKKAAAAAAEEEEKMSIVKVQRNNSASVIDVSHHLKNVQQLSGGGITAERKGSDNPRSLADKLKSGLSIEIPDAPSRTRFSSDPFVEDAIVGAKNVATDSSAAAAATGTSDELKESDILLEELNLEAQSFHLFNIKPDLLDTLYVNYTSLEKAFTYFDRAKKGYITKEDLSLGIAEAASVGLNRRFPNLNADEIAKALDITETGKIDINVFFELFRVTDLHNNPPVDIADDVSLTLECSSKSTSSMRLRSKSVLQLQQVTSSHSPFPLSPVGREHRSDSHLSIEIKGVAINVDELTTAVSHQHTAKSEGKEDAVDV